MRIKSDKRLTFSKKTSKHSYTITPDMGVVTHFPRDVCNGLIELGATEVTKKKSSKEEEAKPAE